MRSSRDYGTDADFRDWFFDKSKKCCPDKLYAAIVCLCGLSEFVQTIEWTTMVDLIGIYGASGCGRGIMPIARAQYGDINTNVVFIDDGLELDMVNGHSVYGWEGFLSLKSIDRAIVIAIANGDIRRKLVEKCQSEGISLLGVKSNNVIIMDEVELGEGCLLSPFVTITSNVRIGHYFHANIYSYVEHDCVIGDYVTFAPRVSCNGNVIIENDVYIGAGAVIKQGQPNKPLIIGERAIIGMGAVVTKDVPAGATVIGNPARPIRKP